MADTAIPQSLGLVNLAHCAACNLHHANIQAWERNGEKYIICPMRIRAVDITNDPLAPAATPAPTAPLADAELQALAALEPTSALPWRAEQSTPHIHNEEPTSTVKGPEGDWFFLTHHADAVYLAAAANALPGLLARLAAAEARDATLQSALESAADTNRVLAERLNAAAEVLKGYEAWEANIIMEDAAWNTPAAHPWQTEELYDEWLDLQHERNKVLNGAAPTAEAGKEPHSC